MAGRASNLPQSLRKSRNPYCFDVYGSSGYGLIERGEWGQENVCFSLIPNAGLHRIYCGIGGARRSDSLD